MLIPVKHRGSERPSIGVIIAETAILTRKMNGSVLVRDDVASTPNIC